MRTLLTIIQFLFISIVYSQNTRIVPDTLGYDSLKQIFYSSGQLFYQVPYKNGKINGWYEQFHENGTVCGKELRIDDKIADGYYIYYSDQGKISSSGNFRNGYQIGKWYEYIDGKPYKVYFYNKCGTPVKMKKWNFNRNRWERTGFY